MNTTPKLQRTARAIKNDPDGMFEAILYLKSEQGERPAMDAFLVALFTDMLPLVREQRPDLLSSFYNDLSELEESEEKAVDYLKAARKAAFKHGCSTCWANFGQCTKYLAHRIKDAGNIDEAVGLYRAAQAWFDAHPCDESVSERKDIQLHINEIEQNTA